MLFPPITILIHMGILLIFRWDIPTRHITDFFGDLTSWVLYF